MFETLGEWERRTGFERVQGDIDALPEVDEPATTTTLPEPEADTVVLLERAYAGLRVELLYDGDGVAIRVTEGEGRPVVQPVPGADAFDAFNHPYCYLPV